MTRREIRSGLAVALVVLPAPFFLAGEPAWALLLIIGLALCGFLLLVSRRRGMVVSEPELALTGALVWTAAQLAPTPLGFAPEVIVTGRELAGLRGWVPLSWDPAGTREMVLVCVAATLAFVVGRRAGERLGRRRVLIIVAASPALIALTAFGHEFLGARRVLGIVDPVHASPALLSPILNANHLGSFLAFGATLWFGLGFSARDARGRLAATLVGVMCAFGALGSGSRAAVMSLAVGVAVALVVAWKRMERKDGRVRNVAIGAGVVAVVAAVFAVTGFSAFSDDVVHGDYSKLGLIRDSFGISFERPLIGVGRGAFEAAFASQGTSNIRFTHPENIVVQWTSEWGWPVALVLFGVWIRVLRRGLRTASVYVAGASAALLGLVVHEQFDFTLELPGLLVVVMVALGALDERRQGAKRVGVHVQLGFTVIVLALSIGLGLQLASSRTGELVKESIRVDEGQVDEFARRVIELHPLDPAATMAVATAMARHERPETLRWLNRAMSLAPAWSGPHEMASRVLGRRGAYSQALLEAKEADRLRAGSAREVLCWLATKATVGHLAAATKSAGDPGGFSRQLSACLPPDAQEELDEQLIEESELPSSLIRRARRRTASGDGTGALADLERVPEHAWTESYRLARARAIGEVRGPDEGIEFLAGLPKTRPLLRTLVDLAADAEDEQLLEESLAELRTMGAGRAREIARVWAIAGRAYRRMGRRGEALDAYQRAHRLDRAELRYRRSIVSLARAEGLHGLVRAHLHAMCRAGQERACEQERALP